MKINIRKGLRLPISGVPQENIDLSKSSKKIAVLGPDFIGMKPTMAVKEGDEVKVGQVLFSDKKNIGLKFTAPSAGKITAINRGDKRALQSVVIELSSSQDQVEFKTYKGSKVSDYSSEDMRKFLIDSGEWISLRQRPYDKSASVNETPNSVFITAIDTNPLAPKPEFIINQYKEEFKAGIEALTLLPLEKVFVCKETDVSLDVPSNEKIKVAEFSGVHPAGNPGTHIHFLDPVNPNKMVWHIGYQAVISIGHLILTGKIFQDKIITLAGPFAKNPRYLKVKKGAFLAEVVTGELKSDNVRVVSGSVFNGHQAAGDLNYLGHYANQVTLLEEDNKREFLGWHSPGLNKFSVKNIYVSKLLGKKSFDFGSSTHGSLRAMVPIGSFEKVMPLDILPTQLLRALVAKDTEQAQDLGCLELAEEDIALLTYVAPGKVDFGPILRENLDIIEREG